MTNDELGRLIAANIGWTVRVINKEQIAVGLDTAELYGLIKPDGRCIRTSRNANDLWESVPDITADPAMTLMLLEIMINERLLEVTIIPTQMGPCVSLEWPSDHEDIAVCRETVGEAIALAYARMEGLI